MGYSENSTYRDVRINVPSYPYRPSQAFMRPVSNWTAPSSYRPNPYKWVNPSLRSGSDQYKADLQPVRSQPRPGPSYSTTYRSRPVDRASPMEGHRSAAPACYQLAERPRSRERSSESQRYSERSQISRSRDQSPPSKRFKGEFIVLDEYSSESDTSLVTSSGSGSSLASSSETGSNTSLSEISSSSSTILYSSGSESSLNDDSGSSLDDDSDCSVATPAVEAHEHIEYPELWGAHLTDDMKRQIESWALEKPEDFVPVTPNLRGNGNKGQLSLKVQSAPKPVLQSSQVDKQPVYNCAPKPCIQSSVVAMPVFMPTQPALQSAVNAWTSPVQRITPGPFPAASRGPSPYPLSSVRCEVARKRPLEEYEIEAAPSAKIHINKNHPRFRHLFQ